MSQAMMQGRYNVPNSDNQYPRIPVLVDLEGRIVTVSNPAAVMNAPSTFVNFTGTGAAAQLASVGGAFVEIKNTTGAPIVIDHGNATATYTLPDQTSKVFHLGANLDELRINAAVGVTVDMEVWW